MYLYVEMWTPKPAWHALSTSQRAEYCAQVGQAVGSLLAQGAEMIGWSLNDPDVDLRLDRPYFAVWKFPSKEAVASFEQMVRAAGWHNYFDQVNVSGQLDTPQAVLGHAINLRT